MLTWTPQLVENYANWFANSVVIARVFVFSFKSIIINNT